MMLKKAIKNLGKHKKYQIMGYLSKKNWFLGNPLLSMTNYTNSGIIIVDSFCIILEKGVYSLRNYNW